ncbi:Major Facilitator Superfamily protein [Prauserella marina]|uniref:Major Facilitator Superfamily protein n=1 Tax=Prauserella marina TaxID=530584 RepID=A0A1G6ISH7_9PSEU|nr:MFS transporter [Prauserella marina]PWV84919.1 MFS transporter [Prauserella marina]SDC09457.1 Major Facilitator Superfamily protein [Prauserella marina]
MSEWGSRRWGVLLVLCGAIFLEGIDIAMLNVALPVIRADLGLATGELQWVVSAYVLGYGGFMLLGGRAADLLGRREVFLWALVVFLVFSGLGGLATESWMLIAARFVTGVAAAFMTPAGLSIITTTFEQGPQRNKALLVYSGIAAGGFTLGLVIGGLLTSLGWRWVFFAPVGLSAVILAFAVPLIPRSVRERRAGLRFDVAGAVTVTGAIVLVVLGVERSAHVPVSVTAATLAAGLALLAVFVVIEKRAKTPLVRLGIFANAALVRAGLTMSLLAAGFFGFQFIVVLYLQELRGWSTLETSLAMLLLGVDVLLSPTVVPKLVARFGTTRVIFGGMLLAAASYVLFLPVAPDWTYSAMIPSLLLLGVAFALAYGPATIAATDEVDEREQGLAGGLLYTSFQFGAALGLSAAAAVNVANTRSGTAAFLMEGYRMALLVPVGLGLAGIVVAAAGLFGNRRKKATGSAAEKLVPVD